MARRSNRLIFAYWDDRTEGVWEYARRGSRLTKHMADCPPLYSDAIITMRRTLYTYGKRVRAKGVRLDAARPNNL